MHPQMNLSVWVVISGLGLRTGREGQVVLRDTMSICLPQSRINSDVTIPDKSLFNLFINTSKNGEWTATT